MESHELFKIRMDLDMTQAELSKLLGISQSHLSNLECGNRIIYPWHVEKVLQTLEACKRTIN